MAVQNSQKKKIVRRNYTTEERVIAVKDASKMGLCASANKHNIPITTLHGWIKKEKEHQSGTKPKSLSKNQKINPELPNVKTKPSQESKPTVTTKKRRIAKIYTPSQRAEIIEDANANGISSASKKFGVSRFSIYDWMDKVESAAQGKGSSPTTGPDPKEIEVQRDKEILDEWHRHPGLGPSQIRNQLKRKKIKVSVNTTRRVMQDAGYRPPKVRRRTHDQRFESIRPNHLWHLDYLVRYINRSKVHILIVLDDYSRFCVGFGTDDAERADLVCETFDMAVQRYGKPEMVIHDKGSAFWSWRGISRFTALLTEFGIDQIVAQNKEWNGKAEVFNANIQKELFDVYHFYDIAEMYRRLQTHLHWYNHQRTHHALGGLLVPADRYYGRVDEVIARIETGNGRDGLDSLQLQHRCLELFKVVSKEGCSEIWLMGQKLFNMPSP